jgi:hypothetical protein
MGFASFASADVTVGGDARVRGIWQSNYDLDSDIDSDDRFFDQRVRLTFTGKTEGGTAVHVRVTAGEGMWSGAANDGGAVIVDSDDYAYLYIPFSKQLNASIGRQLANWGNKFYGWEAPKDRIKIMYAVDDNTTVGLLYDKIVDTTNVNPVGFDESDYNMDDYNSYGVLGITKLDSMKVGLLVQTWHNNTSTAAMTAKGNLRTSGYTGSLFFNGNVGVNLAGEVAFKGGTLFATNEAGKTDENMQMGFFVAASMPVDNLTVGAALAMTMQGYVADDDFQPTLFFGTKQPTAALNFGQCTGGGTCDNTAVVLNASMKVSDAMSAKAVFGYVLQGEYGMPVDTAEANLMELDLGMTYKIMDNVNYSLDFGYLMVDWANGAITTDDPAMALAHKIEVTF